MNRRLEQLRARAEEALVPSEVASVEHELQVHRLELEMQTEELRSAHFTLERMEQTLEQAKKEDRDLFDAAPVGYLRTDPAANIVAANQEAGRMLGTGPERLVGKRFDAFVWPEDVAEFRRHVDGARVGDLVALDIRIGVHGESLPVRMRASISPERWLIAIADRLDVARAELLRREAATVVEAERERTEELRRDFVGQLLRAQDEERRHIALELHDGVGQTLATLELALTRLAGVDSTAEQRNLLQQLMSSVHAAVRELKDVSRGLHPSVLDDQGLGPALQRLVDDQRSRAGIPIELACSAVDGLPTDVALAAYRIVQEAVNNAARHASPSQVKVSVARGSRTLDLAIDDDGRGFSPTNRLRAGLGLRGMRERVERHGGHFAVESHPGDGTTIRASFPIAEPAA